ncbi:MAG: hypothetical protein KKA84_16270 [Bacteroidetes bacterium]|nr:hypothetical protein [Bacteroidota bacterium]
MTISKKTIYLAKLNSIKSVVEKATDKQKQDMVGTILADEFNKLLSEISGEYPDIKDSLPAKITSNGPYSMMYKADSNYIDFEIFTETVISLLNLVDN